MTANATSPQCHVRPSIDRPHSVVPRMFPWEWETSFFDTARSISVVRWVGNFPYMRDMWLDVAFGVGVKTMLDIYVLTVQIVGHSASKNPHVT